ncbi:hypothetical protein ACFQU7_30415 [Pseudoroseomonas wenyumeiae]
MTRHGRMRVWRGRIAVRAAGILLLMLLVLGVLGGGSAFIGAQQNDIIEELGVRQREQTEAVDDFATSIFAYSGVLTSVMLGELRPHVAARRVPRHIELMVESHNRLIESIGTRLDSILLSTTEDMIGRVALLGQEMAQAYAADDRARQSALNENWRTYAVTFNSLIRDPAARCSRKPIATWSARTAWRSAAAGCWRSGWHSGWQGCSCSGWCWCG